MHMVKILVLQSHHAVVLRPINAVIPVAQPHALTRP